MPLPSGLSANRATGDPVPAAKENADTTAIIALLGLLGGAGNALKIPCLVLQAGSTYPARPATGDFPVALWIGTADPVAFTSFAGQDATAGGGDFWLQVPTT